MKCRGTKRIGHYTRMQGQPEATRGKGRTGTYSIGGVVGWSVTSPEVHHTDALTSSVKHDLRSAYDPSLTSRKQRPSALLESPRLFGRDSFT